MQVEGSVALVTGASSGIGRAAALELAAHGARVLVHGRDRDRVEEVSALTGGRPVVADLAERDGAGRVAQAAQAVHGRVDILVNNAGGGWSGPLVDMDEETVRRLVQVDLVAAVCLTRALLPGMLARERGAVCFVGSIAGRTGVAGEAVYAAAKAGLDAFADSLRLELSGSRVEVGVVVPGVVATDFLSARGRPYHRRLPRPVPPEAVARALVTCVRTGRPEVYVPGWLRLPVGVKGVLPGWFGRLSARYGEPVRSRVPGRPADTRTTPDSDQEGGPT